MNAIVLLTTLNDGSINLKIPKHIIYVVMLSVIPVVFTQSTLMEIDAQKMPNGVFVSKAFSISNMSAIPEQDSIYAQEWNILGIIKNISNETQENVGLVGEVYDASNQIIDVLEGSPSFSTLAPGEESAFKINFYTDSKDKVFDHFVLKTDAGASGFDELLSLLGNKTK